MIQDEFASAMHANQQPGMPIVACSDVHICLSCDAAMLCQGLLSILDDRAQVGVGGQHAALVTRNGKLYEWGAGVGGRLLAGSEATSPERVPTLWSRRCVFDGLLLGGFQGVRLVGLE